MAPSDQPFIQKLHVSHRKATGTRSTPSETGHPGQDTPASGRDEEHPSETGLPREQCQKKKGFPDRLRAGPIRAAEKWGLSLPKGGPIDLTREASRNHGDKNWGEHDGEN